MELVTGATGYVGARLLRRLADEGRPLRALARRPERVEPLARRRGGGRRPRDGRRPRGRARRLRHRLLPGALDGGGGRKRLAASPIATASPPSSSPRRPPPRASSGSSTWAASSRPRRPRSPTTCGSRLEVERILLEAVPGSTALRASIVVGAASSSFRILVRLVERLRVLPMPAWRTNRTQPIAERDVIELLARTPATPAAAGRSLDVGGPDVLTYGEMITPHRRRDGRRPDADRPARLAHSPRRPGRRRRSRASRSSSCGR